MPLKIWLDGKLVDKDDAKISVYDHGLLYGDGVFEGIRAYSGKVFHASMPTSGGFTTPPARPG